MGETNLGWLGRLDLPARGRWAPQWLTSVIIGLALVAAASLLRMAIQRVWPTAIPFGLLFPAILMATLFGRWLAGLTCLLVGGLISWFLVLPTMAAGSPFAGRDMVGVMILYILVGTLLLGITEAYRQAEHRLHRERSRKSAAEVTRQRLLAQELNHRVKNTLTTVQAIATQTFGRSSIEREARAAFDARLSALARAHDLLTQAAWTAASLERLVGAAVAPFEDGSRFSIEGPPLSIQPGAAIAISLGLHELATNAIKYGALSAPGGSIGIGWIVVEDRLRLSWIERDGPPVEPPGSIGFGTRLLERGLATEIGGTVLLEYPTTGVRCIIEAPISGLCDTDARIGRGDPAHLQE